MLGRVPFGLLEAQAHEEVDDVFGEVWIHTPTKSEPNFQPEPDRSKPPYMLVVKLYWDAKEVRLGLEDSGVASRDPHLEIRKCQLRYPVNRGDQFQSCATNDRFEATSSQPDTYSGVRVDLVQLGRYAQ